MVVGMDEPRRTLERYWQPDFSKKRKFKDDELLHELDEALRDSVRRHLVADVFRCVSVWWNRFVPDRWLHG